MGKRGPKPKSAAQRIAEGNPAHRPLPPDTKHINYPVLSLTQAPPHLSDAAREIWFRLGSQLCTIGTLQVVDSNAFHRYCDMMARWQELQIDIERNGILDIEYEPELTSDGDSKWRPVMIEDPATGERKVKYRIKRRRIRPEVDEYHRLSAALEKVEKEFGLTPAARSRLHAPDGGGALGGEQKGGKADSGIEEDPFA